MRCICRQCAKEYDNQKSRGDYTGFCSARCQHEMAKLLGWKKSSGTPEYTVLKRAGCVGDVPVGHDRDMKSIKGIARAGAQLKANETGRQFGAYEIGGVWRFGSKSWIDGMDSPPDGLEWFYPQPIPTQAAEIDLSTATTDVDTPVVQDSICRVNNISVRLWAYAPDLPPMDEESAMILRTRLLSAERDLNACFKLIQEARTLAAADASTEQQ